MIRRCSLRPFLSPFSSRAGQQKNSLFQSVRSVHDDSTTEVDPSAVNVVQSIDYKYIIMGLGNVDFMQARHSIGMRVAKFMAHELKGTRFIRDRPLLAQVSTVQLPNSDQILLLKSNLAMNASGKSLRKAEGTMVCDLSWPLWEVINLLGYVWESAGLTQRKRYASM
eukprot:scpid68882/ scgid4893/ 